MLMLTRREILDARCDAQAPLLVQLLFERAYGVREALDAIDLLTNEVLRLQSVLNSQKSTAARSGKKEE